MESGETPQLDNSVRMDGKGLLVPPVLEARVEKHRFLKSQIDVLARDYSLFLSFGILTLLDNQLLSIYR